MFNPKSILVAVSILLLAFNFIVQKLEQFTQAQKQAIKQSCDSVSGLGKPVIGDGSGGWRLGFDGI